LVSPVFPLQLQLRLTPAFAPLEHAIQSPSIRKSHWKWLSLDEERVREEKSFWRREGNTTSTTTTTFPSRLDFLRFTYPRSLREEDTELVFCFNFVSLELRFSMAHDPLAVT
jgi:hypothetical protein